MAPPLSCAPPKLTIMPSDAVGPFVWAARSSAPGARACCLECNQRTESFGDGSIRYGRMKRVACGGWGLGGAEHRNEGHGEAAWSATWTPPGHEFAESLAYLWYLRHVSIHGSTFYTDSANVVRYKSDGQWHHRPIHLLLDLEKNRGADRTSYRRTTRHVDEGAIALWQTQSNKLADSRNWSKTTLRGSGAGWQSSVLVGWALRVFGC